MPRSHYPNLRNPLSIWKKAVVVSPEGDSIQTKVDEKRIFADVTFKASPISTNDAPRQQSEVKAIVREHPDLDFRRPKDYTVTFEGRDWQVSSSYPHELKGYFILILKDIV